MKTQTNNLTYSKTFLVFAIILLLAGGEMWGQKFVNNGTYNATCGAIIRLKDNNTDATGLLTGTSTWGTTGNSIPGTVEYASETAAGSPQNVQARFYDKLIIASTVPVNVPDGVHIVGSACLTAEVLPGYVGILDTYPFYVTNDAITAEVTFAGNFYYSGAGDQTVFPLYTATLDQPNNYFTIYGNGGGNVIIPDGENIGASNIITEAGTSLTIEGTLYTGDGTSTLTGNTTMDDGDLITGDGAVAFEGTLALDNASTITSTVGNVTFNNSVTLDDLSTITVTGAGSLLFTDDLTLTSGSLIIGDNTAGLLGSITLEGTTTLAGDNSILSLGNLANLIITGDITNSGSGINLLFDCGSNVTYNGIAGQDIMATTFDNPYGNLFVTAAGEKSPVGNIFSCGNFTLKDENLPMGAFFLAMKDESKLPSYPDETEVIGQFRRYYTASTDALLFNNSATSVKIVNPDKVNFITLNVQPGNKAEIPEWDATLDIDRTINFSYDDVDLLWSAEVQYGFRYDETPTGATEADLKLLRFREKTGAATSEKVATNAAYTRDVADASMPFKSVTLPAIRPTGGAVAPQTALAEVADNGLLFLRGGPTEFYSVQNGRWTNPATWDEYSVPTENDNANIRNVVYVGIAPTTTFVGTTPPGNTTPENTHYSGSEYAANTITIDAPTATYANPALIIGNEDNPPNYVFRTKSNTSNTFVNNNTTAPTLAFPWDSGTTSKETIAATALQGLWIMQMITQEGGVDRIPALGTNQIQNAGTINNEGVIEVGQ